MGKNKKSWGTVLYPSLVMLINSLTIKLVDANFGYIFILYTIFLEVHLIRRELVEDE
jgi:hypothetical protein